MTQLRTQLEAARREHRSAVYPGDLAADVLPRPAWRRWLLVSGGFGAGSLAAAATIVLGLARFGFIDRGADEPPRSVVRQVADRHLPGLTVPNLPMLPKGLTEVHAYERLLPPGLPDWRDLPLLRREQREGDDAAEQRAA